MRKLLEKYINSCDIDNALLVGRNIVNRTPSDREGVKAYFDFLIELAENLPALDDRRDYSDQAEVILAYVSENAEISEEYILMLSEMRNKVNEVSRKITEAENKKIEDIISKIEHSNSQSIKKIYSVCEELKEVDNQEDFEKYMIILNEEDSLIDKEYLSDELKQQYDILTKECTELISKKMQEIEHQDNIKYNSNAVDVFSEVFEKFRDNESLYKKDMNALQELVSDTLFHFETQRLFSETLIYYNHIYQFIFEKMEEEGRLALTRFAVEASKKRG